MWEEVRGEERHLEHGAHVCDARRVEAERVVETRLPRVASAVHCSGALRAGEGGRRRATAVQKARRGGLAAADCEQGNREERTRNMELMSVTLDVSKLSGWLKADAACRVERRACDVGRGAGWEA